MAELPKLRVKGLGWRGSGDVRDFDQAKHLPFGHGMIIMVEGQVIRSYEALVQLAGLESHKDKEFLEVKLLPLLGGG